MSCRQGNGFESLIVVDLILFPKLFFPFLSRESVYNILFQTAEQLYKLSYTTVAKPLSKFSFFKN